MYRKSMARQIAVRRDAKNYLKATKYQEMAKLLQQRAALNIAQHKVPIKISPACLVNVLLLIQSYLGLLTTINYVKIANNAITSCYIITLQYITRTLHSRQDLDIGILQI